MGFSVSIVSLWRTITEETARHGKLSQLRQAHLEEYTLLAAVRYNTRAHAWVSTGQVSRALKIR